MIRISSNLNFPNIKELRILTRNQCFYLEFIYEKQVVKVNLNPKNVLSVDPKLNNWLTCVSNIGTSFIVDGQQIKSMNRWYNRQVDRSEVSRAILTLPYSIRLWTVNQVKIRKNSANASAETTLLESP